MTMRARWVECVSRSAASAEAARCATQSLWRGGLFLVSGGTTPAEMFEQLSHSDLNWSRIIVGLTDERWLAPDHPDSNERLVRATLLQAYAGAAGFLPLRTFHDRIEAAAADRSIAYAPHRPNVVLLGMGTDGHTASWFPGAKGTGGAMDLKAAQSVAAIDATGCAVAGKYAERLTVTAPVVMAAEAAILLMFGDEKRRVFEQALTASPDEMPIRSAIDGLGERLTVIWAP